MSVSYIKKLDILENIFLKYKNELATSISQETWKPIKFSNFEIDRCINLIKTAKDCFKNIKLEEAKIENYSCYKRLYPMGTILAFTPFSSPYSSLIHKYLPSLALNNKFLWKPSPFTYKSSYKLYKLIHELVPENNLDLLKLKNNDETMNFIKNKNNYDGILFTGSSNTAELIKKEIGRTKAIFETGSSALVYVQDVKNEKEVIKTILHSAFSQTGFRCIAAKNIFLHESLKETFIQHLDEIMDSIIVGDPLKTDVIVSKIKESHFTPLSHILTKYKKLNCPILYGGIKQGFFLKPTIILVKNNIISNDDCFGPICFVHFVAGISDIPIAYWKRSSLSSSIYSNNKKIIDKFVNKAIYSGLVEINFGPSKRFDELPFGGFYDENEGKENFISLYNFLNKEQWVCKKNGC